jgi:hypothetical protein
MSLGTLRNLLTLTIAIILANCLQLLWEDLMNNDLEMLENERATYLERIICLCLSKFTLSWLILILAMETFQTKITLD